MESTERRIIDISYHAPHYLLLASEVLRQGNSRRYEKIKVHWYVEICQWTLDSLTSIIAKRRTIRNNTGQSQIFTWKGDLSRFSKRLKICHFISPRVSATIYSKERISLVAVDTKYIKSIVIEERSIVNLIFHRKQIQLLIVRFVVAIVLRTVIEQTLYQAIGK